MFFITNSLYLHTDPIVSLSAVIYSAFENEASVTICAVLTLVAADFPSGLTSEVAADLTTSDGTACKEFHCV